MYTESESYHLCSPGLYKFTLPCAIRHPDHISEDGDSQCRRCLGFRPSVEALAILSPKKGGYQKRLKKTWQSAFGFQLVFLHSRAVYVWSSLRELNNKSCLFTICVLTDTSHFLAEYFSGHLAVSIWLDFLMEYIS